MWVKFIFKKDESNAFQISILYYLNNLYQKLILFFYELKIAAFRFRHRGAQRRSAWAWPSSGPSWRAASNVGRVEKDSLRNFPQKKRERIESFRKTKRLEKYIFPKENLKEKIRFFLKVDVCIIHRFLLTVLFRHFSEIILCIVHRMFLMFCKLKTGWNTERQNTQKRNQMSQWATSQRIAVKTWMCSIHSQ